MQVQNGISGFLIRVATATDVDRLAELHCASFHPEDDIPLMLGKNYIRATYRWMVTSSQTYCLAADLDHKIIGLIAVCDHPYARRMFWACLPELVISLICSPKFIFETKLWKRMLRRSSASKGKKLITDYSGFAQMIIGAVDTEYRGAGIFPALVEATKTYSKNRGSLAIRAGVYKNNQPSRRVFVKSGWTETPELETPNTVFYTHRL